MADSLRGRRETRQCVWDKDHCSHAWPSTWRLYWCPGKHVVKPANGQFSAGR